jgi:hypothetical protein
VFPLTEEQDYFVSLDYEASGYIEDDEAAEWDADALLQGLKDGTEAANTDMALLAAPNVLKAWRGIRGAEEATYYTVRPDVRVQYAALYLGLAGFLAIMCNNLHEELVRV